MKKSIVILLVVSIFSSCSSMNRIIEIDDSKKDIKGFRLIQNPKVHSAQKNENTLVNQFFNIQTTYLFEERNNQNPVVTLEFCFTAPDRPEKLDSAMYLKLDDENVRLISGTSIGKIAKKKPASVNQNDNNVPMAYQYEVPENLWLSVAHSKFIIYKLSSGKKGIEIKPDPDETNKVREFFSKAMKRRLEIIPLIPPGKVKW